MTPRAVWDQYNLDQFHDNGWVYARADKGMYGLPQAGRVAYDHLVPILNDAGYYEASRTPGLFCHNTNDIVFTQVVDDFLIQHTTEVALQHLIDTLQQHYTITTDRLATKYCGMQLNWNYDEGHVTLLMPGYVERALHRFMHSPPHTSHNTHPTSGGPHHMEPKSNTWKKRTSHHP